MLRLLGFDQARSHCFAWEERLTRCGRLALMEQGRVNFFHRLQRIAPLAEGSRALGVPV